MPILPVRERVVRRRWPRTFCAALGLVFLPLAHGADDDALAQSVRQWLQHEVATEPRAQPGPAAVAPAEPAASAPLELRAIYGVGPRLTAEFLSAGVALRARSGRPRLRGTAADTALALLEIQAPCARLRRTGGELAELCILPMDEPHE